MAKRKPSQIPIKKPRAIPPEKQRLPVTPKIRSSKVESFSKKGSGSFAGGGNAVFDFPNQDRSTLLKASSILKKYKTNMVFWQASQYWVITQGRTRYTIQGYSPAQTSRRNSPASILKALADSAINALKRRGFNADYEGKIPTNVSYPKGRAGKEFQLHIWFVKEHRQLFIK